MKTLTRDTKIFIKDRKAKPENSISPDGKRIKKGGKWVRLPDSTKAAKKIDPKIWGTAAEVKEKAKLK